MNAVIEPIGDELQCLAPASTVSEWRIKGSSVITALRDWAARYDTAVRNGKDADLLNIGHEMLGWLDGNGWATAWLATSGRRVLQVRVDNPNEPLSQALLDAPWELLAHQGIYLADETVQVFEIARRIGREGPALQPRHCDLGVLFMAAAPEGMRELDFEAEETAIVDATERLPMQLLVEESGAASILAERLAQDEPFEALHISCHGYIDDEHGPLLALEDETGASHFADVGELTITRSRRWYSCRPVEQRSRRALGSIRRNPSFVP